MDNTRTFQAFDVLCQDALAKQRELLGRVGFYDGKEWVCRHVDWAATSGFAIQGDAATILGKLTIELEEPLGLERGLKLVFFDTDTMERIGEQDFHPLDSIDFGPHLSGMCEVSVVAVN